MHKTQISDTNQSRSMLQKYIHASVNRNLGLFIIIHASTLPIMRRETRRNE